MVIDDIQLKTRKEKIANWYTELFPLVAAYVHRHGGSLEEAKEVFQEAIVLYYEKLCTDNFTPEKSDQAYLMGIVKKKWIKHTLTREKNESLNGIDLAEIEEQELNTQKLMNHLKVAGKKCLDLLQSYYYEKLSMSQLANRFGYTSERSATVQKYKCLEKVRATVKLKSLEYEDFIK